MLTCRIQRNFEVKVQYMAKPQATPNYNVLATNTAAMIHQSLGPGDILIFLPGQGEISQVCELLSKATNDLDVRPLYSALSASDQRLAFGSSGPNRKCIVATNIAETSLTIPNIVYVIDTGLSKQMIYNPRLGMDMLQTLPISQASARQRTGRAGRTQNGICFRLYSEEDFDTLAPSTAPAIRSKATHVAALRLISIGYIKVLDFDWIDAPYPEGVTRAAQDLLDWYVSSTEPFGPLFPDGIMF